VAAPGQVLVLPSGLEVVVVDDLTCRRARAMGLQTFGLSGGKVCAVRLEDAARLGLVPVRPSPVEALNPALRLGEILSALPKRGQGGSKVTTSVYLSRELLVAVDMLARRYRVPRTRMIEALLRLALEMVGVQLGEKK